MSLVEYGSFKGNKWIRLKSNETDAYPLQIGIDKAKKIIQHYQAIKDFAENKNRGDLK